MQGELRLHEDVRRCPFPWLALAKQAAVNAIVVKHCRTNTSGAMVVAWFEETDAIDAVGL